MNELAQFLHYCNKVFRLAFLMRQVRDHRPQAVIPTRPVFVTLLMGVVLRFSSYWDNGPKINLLLDLEPIRPGEEEAGAALRLLGRMRRLYGARFFDAITVDAWYVKGPFLRAVDKLGWDWVVVLKQERMDLYKEAVALSAGRKPEAHFHDQKRAREIRLWQIKDLSRRQNRDP